MDSSTNSLCGASELLALLDSSQTSLWAPSTTPLLHETMMNFDHQQQPLSGKRPSSSLGPIRRGGSEGDDGLGEDDIEISGLSAAEKKRRLSAEQVQFLEKCFEIDNKLEPDRKMHLAKELGLQPRQVAVWFQNRRARYKTKQIEKDYDSLRTSYDQLKADYDFVVKEKEGLQKELNLLTSQLKQRNMEAKLQQDNQQDPLCSNLLHDEVPKIDAKEMHEVEKMAAPSISKQVEDASSAESDIVDSESPLCTEANASSLMEDPVDQPANFSQDNEVNEDDQLIVSRNLLFPPPPPTPLTFTNLLKGDECYDPNGTSCDVPLIDGHPAWSWLD